VTFTCLVAALVLASSAFGQKLDLKFDAIAARASEKVELDLDAGLLKLFLKMSGEADRDRDGWFGGLKALRISSYNFEKSGGYSDKDLETLRNQVNAQSKFARILTQKTDDESNEIWVAADGDKLGACLIIAAEPKELSVIYLEGTFSLDQIKGFIQHEGAQGFLRLAAR